MADGNFESIQLVELSYNSPLIDEAKSLLKEYGDYMYEDLGLIAGKENFLKSLNNFQPRITYRLQVYLSLQK